MNELINMAPVPSTNKCITTDPLIHGKLRPDPQAGHQKVTHADGWFYYLFFPSQDWISWCLYQNTSEKGIL